MDGTLAETEQYWDMALEDLAVRLGGVLSPEVRGQTTGASVPDALVLLYADLGVGRSAAEAAADGDWWQQQVIARLREEVRWRPGALALLDAVRSAGLRTALVTTTHRPLVSIVLGHLAADLEGEAFELTVTGDEVPAVKPDPAPYLQAMAALGVTPEECVVIEDSRAGAASGLAAGAAVLGVPSFRPLPEQPGLTVRDTLVGVQVGDLRDVLAAGVGAPARDR